MLQHVCGAVPAGQFGELRTLACRELSVEERIGTEGHVHLVLDCEVVGVVRARDHLEELRPINLGSTGPELAKRRLLFACSKQGLTPSRDM